jgi:3-oxoacyl-[acyl-carrier-protein] synthase-1
VSTPKAVEARVDPARGAWIVEVGARCPLGLNSLQVTTAARARKLEARESRLVDKRNQPVGTVRSRFLPEDLFGIERLVRLGAPALREAGRHLLGPVPLVVGIADRERPDVGDDVEADLLPRLVKASEVAVDEARSLVVRGGHASFVGALEAALVKLEQGAPAVLVGCVDSLVHPAAVAWLDAAHRLHADGTEDGIIPSEAAAFALLVPGGPIDARAFRAPAPTPLAALRWARSARDESALDPEGPIAAETLTSLVQAALSALGAPPAWLMTDLDEMHRVREWSRVELRCHPVFERAEHCRVPDLFGDVGAATGALAAAYACRGWALGGAPRDAMVAALAADGAARGVFALQEAGEGSR